ncbi:MAG: branched-chain amino acid ABC transporter permease [Pseudomonadota bacterium]
MDIYLIQALHGLVYGMLIFMVASGLTLVFGMMGILNLAHASFYMLGAYFAYTVTVYLGNFWLSLIISPLIVGTLGILTERFLLRPIHVKGHVAELLLTFGLFYVLGELVRIIWGSNPLPVPVPGILKGDIPFFEMTYPIYRLFILVFSAALLVGTLIVLMKTRIGILIRAATSDTDMVDALGTNVPVLFMGVFGGGAALAAVAGVIAAPFLSVFPGMGLDVLLDCFVVVVIGGMGSMFGAFVAAVMIGELQSFGVLWVPRFAMVFQFMLMAVVLIVRPTGLFGEVE